MIPDDTVAVQHATLPFVLLWKELQPELNVVSLDATPQGWDMLLAGQGIDLHIAYDQVPEGCSVITGFNDLDAHSSVSLGPWASDALRALRPGGLLIIGGSNPEHADMHGSGLFPACAAQILKTSGFARIRIIRPVVLADDDSLTTALFGMGTKYALVAQKEAFSKEFDIFSAVFSEASKTTVQIRMRRAEADIQARIQQAQSAPHDRASLMEAALQERPQQVQTMLQEREQDIAELRATITELKRLTRRRGLRKLVYKLRTAWQKWRAVPPSPPTASGASEVAETLPRILPDLAHYTQSSDPVPLSSRETAVHARLFDRQTGR